VFIIEPMKYFLFIVLFPLLLNTCPQKGKSRLAPNLSVAARDTTEEDVGAHVACHIRLRILDEYGNDLLNPSSSSPKAIDGSKIKFYYVRGGKELPCGFEGRPRGGYVITPEGGASSYYTVKVFLDISPEDSITTTLLDWGDGHRDVFKAYFFRQPGVIIRQKVWLNDSLILDIPKRYGPKDLIFTIRR